MEVLRSHDVHRNPQKQSSVVATSDDACIDLIGVICSGSHEGIESWYRELRHRTSFKSYDYLILCALWRFRSDLYEQTKLLPELRRVRRILTSEKEEISTPERLPQSFLRKQDRRFRAFHAAVFLRDPQTRDYNLWACLQDKVWEWRDIAVTALIFAALWVPYGLQVVLGFLCGLVLLASFNEMLTHRHVGHTGKRMQALFDRWGKLGRSLNEISLAHKLHHIKVKEEFTVSFRNPFFYKQFEKVAMDHFQKLAKKNGALDVAAETSKLFRAFVVAGYGVNATLSGSTRMFVAAIPGFVLVYVLHHFFQLPAFSLSATLFGAFFIFQSLYSHRYLHLNRSDIEGGDHQTTPFMRWFMRTRTAQFQQRLHFVHHQYGLFDEYNDVIMTGSGADWILGKVKAPNCLDLVKMNRQKFLDY